MTGRDHVDTDTDTGAGAGSGAGTETDGGTATGSGAGAGTGPAGDPDTVAAGRSERPIVRRARRFVRRFRRNRLATVGLLILAVFLVVALFPGQIAPQPYDSTDVPNRLEGPSVENPMGTDRYGRDIFSRVVFGARIAFQVAVLTPLVAMSVGVPVGLLAGYYRGLLDDALMRVMDSIFAFPTILLGLTLVAVFGQSLTNIVLALGIVFVPQFARITRGSALSVSKENHVKVARSLGASDARILALHVFPFCLSAILVQATITAALAIILESSLSFLGVGVPPPRPSWGGMLRVGKGFVGSGEWWYSVFPGLAIVFSVLGFNLLGDGLRSVLDPRTDPDRGR
jgi:ABC-type dipeptide/oligopeptide/nickel transport system permease subunit